MPISILVFTLLLLFTPLRQIGAVSDPLSVPNNKYGIHIIDANDLTDAATLVNSSGGDWGYVTLVIQDGDRNQGKWQEIFNTMRRRHLIPLIRLATHAEGSSWKIPQKEDADRWAGFLNSLIWPTQNRYVILFNEPNHSKEWGNTINPEEYADVALTYAQALKRKSGDFFLLPAGLDMSASSDGEALDGATYLRRMATAKPELFTQLDGWTSHSYPNPGFSGPPWASGRGTIAGYRWELQLLQSLGFTKSYPVFITETGWTHNGGTHIKGILSPTDVSENIRIAAAGAWSDERIVSITPFLLNYQGGPFDHFSWKKPGMADYFPQYLAYKELTKTKGEPSRRESFGVDSPFLPDRLVTHSTYTVQSVITNTGQGILTPGEYTIDTVGLPAGFSITTDALPVLEPGESGVLRLTIRTPDTDGTYSVPIRLRRGEKRILLEERQVTVIPPPSLSITVPLAWKKNTGDTTATVLIYDMNDRLLHKFLNVTVANGTAAVTGLYNIVPGTRYRTVVLVPYYLPRQAIIPFTDTRTDIRMKRLYPLDYNNDGTLNFMDIPALLLTKPNEALSRIF